MSDPLPSYSESSRAGRYPRTTDAVQRLFWSLQGPLQANVFVLEDPANPDGTREAYFRQTLSGTSWHPISQEPLTQPGVSSVAVEASPLAGWLWDWIEYHEHAAPGEDGCVYERVADDHGDEDQDEDDDEFRGLKLMRCCNQDRPGPTPTFVVRASDQPYVTIHDYVTTVHPWLMGLRTEILSALGVFDGQPLPAETKLAVAVNAADQPTVNTEEEWLLNQRSQHRTYDNRPRGGAGAPEQPGPGGMDRVLWMMGAPS
ncbi:hypothetical protein B0T10DRAFT_501306 [Thelonectria olida]|uniref:Uncharacterized protein n=1 Tax=Thelonectria olida TaxID=1576542 RepID=A0A9P9AEI0_9HYPO|nr:hypothetical protein B0T10DRAFT_501306 [Thelonectria olida]